MSLSNGVEAVMRILCQKTRKRYLFEVSFLDREPDCEEQLRLKLAIKSEKIATETSAMLTPKKVLKENMLETESIEDWYRSATLREQSNFRAEKFREIVELTIALQVVIRQTMKDYQIAPRGTLYTKTAYTSLHHN